MPNNATPSRLRVIIVGLALIVVLQAIVLAAIQLGQPARDIVLGTLAAIVFGGLLYTIFVGLKASMIDAMAEQPLVVAEINASPPEDIPPAGADWSYVGTFETKPVGDAKTAFSQKVTMWVWKSPDCRRLVRIELPVQKKIGYAVTTSFEGPAIVNVTTADYRDVNNLPHRPGVFVECFPGSSIQDLEQHHAVAVSFVRDRLGLAAVEDSQQFEDIVAVESREQALFARSIPGWKNKALLWELRRSKYDNVSVSERWSDTTRDSLERDMRAWMKKVIEVEAEVDQQRLEREKAEATS